MKYQLLYVHLNITIIYFRKQNKKNKIIKKNVITSSSDAKVKLLILNSP